MQWRSLLTIIYGLILISTGLLRGIEAVAYKPNALFFCLTFGTIAIVAGYLYRMNKGIAGSVIAMVAAVPVLIFYFSCFVSQPDKDANLRVAVAIVASIAQIIVSTLPCSGGCETKSAD
ncbi:MAG: hypothetical protein ACI9HK_003271 [Pirellulaceae bacterium]|jgi:hypothetical protein